MQPGDGQAALYSALAIEKQAVLNMGSIASIAVQTKDSSVSLDGFAKSVLYSKKEDSAFLLEGITTACGAVIKYLKDDLKIIADESELVTLDDPGYMPELLAYLPIHGTATPLWKKDIPLTFSEDTTRLEKKEVVSASLYSIGSFIVKNILLLQEAKLIEAKALIKVSGGVSRSKMLLQYISSLTACSFYRDESSAGSAMGILSFIQGSALPGEGVGSKIKVLVEPGSREVFAEYYESWLGLERQCLSLD